MNLMNPAKGAGKAQDARTLRFRWLMVLALVMFTAGCAGNAVILYPSEEVKKSFETSDIQPADYAFFTTGADSAPEGILLIKNQYLGEFDSSGWKLRDKNEIMEMLKKISTTAASAKKYGYPVVDGAGTVKGMMFTAFPHAKVFIDKSEGTFVVATPAMMDTGRGTFKRTSCSVSVCN